MKKNSNTEEKLCLMFVKLGPAFQAEQSQILKQLILLREKTERSTKKRLSWKASRNLNAI